MTFASRLTVVLSAFLFIFGPAFASAAVDPATKCESAKLKATGKHGSCLLKAEAKAALKGLPADPTKCRSKLAKIWAKAESKAAGQCPTGGDVDLVDGYVTAYARSVAGTLGRAVTSATKCQSSKLKVTAKFTKKRLTNEAKALIKQEPADQTKVTTKFTEGFDQLETKYSGECPTVGDATQVADETVEHNDTVVSALAGVAAACPSLSYLTLKPIEEGVPVGVAATRLDTGWTGLGHGAEVAGGVSLPVRIQCAASTAPCGDCDVIGLDAGFGNCRCDNDPTQTCNAINSEDVDDCGAGVNCSCYVLSPQPQLAGGVPSCYATRLAVSPTGTINPETGDVRVDLQLLQTAYVGSAMTAPCPRCTAGVCDGGSRNGQTCAVDAMHSVFGPLSLDCPADPGQNISGSGTNQRLTLRTGNDALPFIHPCDFPLGSLDCACGACSGDASVACWEGLDCSAVPGAGSTCQGGNTSGAPTQPNACATGVCNDLGAGRGECSGGPIDNYCDGFVDANGEGLIHCANNTDCADLAAQCPGQDCGSCTVTQTRSCFLDPVTTIGSPDVAAPTLAGAACQSPTTSSAVDASFGLPGPMRVTINTNQGFGDSLLATDDCVDADGDGFSDVACGGTDCYDGNAKAFPQVANLRAMKSRGDGSYDYDCDGDQDEKGSCADKECTDWLSDPCGVGVCTNTGGCRLRPGCVEALDIEFCLGGLQSCCTIQQGGGSCAASAFANCLSDRQACLRASACDVCPMPQVCSSITGDCCLPQCSGKVCGDDGCGGVCGLCSIGTGCCASGTACCVE